MTIIICKCPQLARLKQGDVPISFSGRRIAMQGDAVFDFLYMLIRRDCLSLSVRQHVAVGKTF